MTATEFEEFVSEQEVTGSFDPESDEATEAIETLIEESAENEIYYASEDLVALPLPDDAILVAPATADIESVEFSASEDEINAAVVTSNEDVLGQTGMGMGKFQHKASGSHAIKVPGKAHMTANWYKYKMASDGDSKWDYWAYTRWATVTPVPIKNALDWNVKRIKLRSWPYTSHQKNVKMRMKAAPASATSGNCKAYPLSFYLEGSYKNITAGVNLQLENCISTKPYAGENPGDYSVELKQGLNPRGGQQDTGYTEVVKVKNGFTPSWNDSQEFQITRMLSSIDCGKTNDSRTCNK